MSPLTLFRRVAIAEAVTWALLLTGMFLKYVTETTELGVQVFGLVHGVVFVAYCLVILLVAVDQRWSLRLLVGGLACAVPPFATVPFERYAVRRGAAAGAWRLVTEHPRTWVESVAAWLLRHPVGGLAAGALGVFLLTGAALLVGPPVG